MEFKFIIQNTVLRWGKIERNLACKYKKNMFHCNILYVFFIIAVFSSNSFKQVLLLL